MNIINRLRGCLNFSARSILTAPLWIGVSFVYQPAVLAASAVLEEVIVTARKREESIQDTPISITAFSEEDMEQANMIDLRDIGKYTPGMSFTSYGMGSSESGAIFIRGVGQSDHMVTTDPGVGLYIDGVYMGRTQGAALDLIDLERTEVLRGPQGTLFGKNTIGGAVNVVSRKPTGENGGQIGLSIGDKGRLNAAVTAELALGEDFSVRASLQAKNRDGVGKQVFTGDETGDESSIGGRGQLYWQGDAAEVSVVVDFTRARQQTIPHTLYAHGSFLGLSTCYTDTGDTSIGLDRYIPCPAGTDVDVFDSYSLDDLDSEQDLFGVSATWSWDINDLLQVKSVVSYRDMEYLGNLEFDGAPVRLLHYLETGESDQFSWELQLSGQNSDHTVDWIAGVYYFTEEGYNLQDDDVFSNLDQRRSDVETDSYAAFGQGSFALAPGLNLTAGLRYTREDKDYSVVYRRISGEALADGTAFLIPPTRLDDSWGAVSGTVSLDYDINEALMLYATYSRGFRSGGFNARPAMPVNVNLYDPEYLDMYELGLKLETDRLRANISLYSSNYEDYQTQVNELDAVSATFVTRTLNAAEAEINGAELEITALWSDNFRLVGSYAYTDAEISKIDSSLQASFAEGVTLPYVSKYTWSISPQLDLQMSGGGSVLLRADYSHRSSFYGQIANAPEEREDGYGLFNARVEYRPPDEKWSLAVYGINLADKEYARVRNYFPGFIGFALWNTDRREIGLKGTYNF